MQQTLHRVKSRQDHKTRTMLFPHTDTSKTSCFEIRVKGGGYITVLNRKQDIFQVYPNKKLHHIIIYSGCISVLEYTFTVLPISRYVKHGERKPVTIINSN